MFVCWILTFSSWGWNATIFRPVVPLTHNFAFHRCLFHCRMREQSSCEAWASCLASCSVLEWRLCISSSMKFLRIRLHQKSYIPWPLPLRWGHLPSVSHSCGHQIMTGSAFWVSTPFMSFEKWGCLSAVSLDTPCFWPLVCLMGPFRCRSHWTFVPWPPVASSTWA